MFSAKSELVFNVVGQFSAPRSFVNDKWQQHRKMGPLMWSKRKTSNPRRWESHPIICFHEGSKQPRRRRRRRKNLVYIVLQAEEILPFYAKVLAYRAHKTLQPKPRSALSIFWIKTGFKLTNSICICYSKGIKVDCKNLPLQKRPVLELNHTYDMSRTLLIFRTNGYL